MPPGVRPFKYYVYCLIWSHCGSARITHIWVSWLECEYWDSTWIRVALLVNDYQCAVLVCAGSATTKGPYQCGKTTPPRGIILLKQKPNFVVITLQAPVGTAVLLRGAGSWHSYQQSIMQRGHELLWPLPIGRGWGGVLAASLEVQGELKDPLLFPGKNKGFLGSYFALFWVTGFSHDEGLWHWADSINNILKVTNILTATEGHLYTPGKNTDCPLKRS